MTLNFIGSTDIYEDKDSVISEYENAGRNNMNKVKLNLGCGSEVLEGYENYDFFPVDKRVNFIDLSKLPLSFTDNSVDEILLAHTLEHLIDPMSFVMDCHRILKPDGRLVIKVPARGSSLAHLRAYHTVGYMRCVSSSSKESNGHQQRLFNVITTGKLRNKKWWIGDFKNWIINLFVDEWTYDMRKIK